MPHRRDRNVLAAAVASTLIFSPMAVCAVPGDLDTTFSSDGFVTDPPAGWQGESRAIKPLADGSLLEVGTGYWNPSIGVLSGIRGLLAKYHNDGSLDTTFASSGVYVTPQGVFFDVALTPGGQIIVVGKRQTSPGVDMLTLYRFNADGSLDTSWGSSGLVEVNIGTVYNARVAVQSNGAIVVAALPSTNAEVLRFNADGTLDSSFDSDGRRTLDFGGIANLTQSSLGLALQSDGKTLVGTTDKGGYYDFAVWRLNSDGSPDTTFDNSIAFKDGKAVYDLGYSDFLNDIAVLGDGKIVLVGRTIALYNGPSVGLVFRVNSNGGWATDFNGGSYVTTDFASTYMEEFSRVVVQGNGKIVALGHGMVSTTYPSTQNFIAARYNTDGSLDTTFNSDGMLETTFGNSSCDATFAAAIDADGKIYLGGETKAGTPTWMICNGTGDFAMVRLEGDGPSVGDTLPPTVVSVTPTNGIFSVPINASLSATFSEPLDGATVNSSTVKLSCNSTTINGTASYDAGNKSVTFIPATAMPYTTSCTATLTSGITDVAGNGLASNYTWSFFTISASNVDTTPPTVAGVAPYVGETNVKVTSGLIVNFSEPLDSTSVDNNSVTLVCGTTTIPLSVNYASVANSLAIVPTMAMPEGTSCTATAKSTMTDVSGNALTSDYSWSFVTEGAAGIPTTSSGGGGGGGAIDLAWLLLGLPLIWRRRNSTR